MKHFVPGDKIDICIDCIEQDDGDTGGTVIGQCTKRPSRYKVELNTTKRRRWFHFEDLEQPK